MYRRGMSDTEIAVEAHIGSADVKLQSSGRNQRASPRAGGSLRSSGVPTGLLLAGGFARLSNLT